MVSSVISSSVALVRREILEFEVLWLLGVDPGVSQRAIAGRLQTSIGRINYCMKALVERGMVRHVRYRPARAKRLHAYELTPQGIAERLSLAGGHMQRKLNEVERLNTQIEALRQVMCAERES